MSVAALAEHIGPWTPDDVEALPDAGDHARFEAVEIDRADLTRRTGPPARRPTGHTDYLAGPCTAR